MHAKRAESRKMLEPDFDFHFQIREMAGFDFPYMFQRRSHAFAMFPALYVCYFFFFKQKTAYEIA